MIAWTLITVSTFSNEPPMLNASRKKKNEKKRRTQPTPCQEATVRR